MKVVGLWSGHDCSFCVLEDGQPIIHAEYERYNREKSPQGDSGQFLIERYGKDWENIKYFASVHPIKKLSRYPQSWELIKSIATKNNGNIFLVPHHKAHAANAFYSSNFSNAIIITLDGGGQESETAGDETACTIFTGEDKILKHFKTFRPHEINIGGVWSRVTRYVFKLQNGWPLGGQEGTVMAMAAFGDEDKYFDDCWKWLTHDKIQAGFKPPAQPVGAYVPGKDPIHPYLDPWVKIAESSEKEKFNIAASLQNATEFFIKQIIGFALENNPGYSDICLSGGVTLNSVAMGKIRSWFPQIKNIYIPPVPYDGGLCIGAAQIAWHEILNNDRIIWKDNFTPFLGEIWPKEHIDETLKEYSSKINSKKIEILEMINHLQEGKIISVFNGSSESGRRALGNRSILADPRNKNMKDIINEKVKHRQWFRPFAPSILEEYAKDWFEDYLESPYMQFVLKFKKDKLKKVPAVVHKNGTARLQTVRETDNKWYYNFLRLWNEVAGVPIILNTSFNDREPICENLKHAMNCFLGTEIDYLYLPEYELLISRKE